MIIVVNSEVEEQGLKALSSWSKQQRELILKAARQWKCHQSKEMHMEPGPEEGQH